MGKAVLISIRPEWVKKILDGELKEMPRREDFYNENHT